MNYIGNEELSEEEKKLIEDEFKREDETQEQKPENILVRGALLRCSCGTHSRRLNLPLSYGVDAIDANGLAHPKVHEKNCIVGNEENISYYGVCKSEHGPNSEDICLEAYVMPDGTKTSKGNVSGKKCTPIIMGNWFDVKEDDKIYDPDRTENLSGLTTNSFMICKYGGLITVETSGQEYSD